MTTEELVILSDDGSPLYNIGIDPNGDITIKTYMVAKHGDVVLDTPMVVYPSNSSRLTISRKEYK